MRLISNGLDVWNVAVETADANGCPVAVVERDGWYAVIEDAEEYERLIADEGYRTHAVVEPTDAA